MVSRKLMAVVAAALIAGFAAVSCTAAGGVTQKVNYQGGYKRLSAVADDLSKLTKVSIRAGASAQDWKVRDIPVFVVANRLALADLLHALADATHTRVLKDGSGYRFVRDKKTQDMIDRLYDLRLEDRRAEAKWAWGVMNKFADMSYPRIRTGPRDFGMGDDEEATDLVSAMIHSLDAATRDKALAGEPVLITAADAPDETAFDKLVKYSTRGAARTEANMLEPSEGIAEPTLRIQLVRDKPGAGQSEFEFSMMGIAREGKGLISFDYSVIDLAQTVLNQPELKMPQPPKPLLPDFEELKPPSAYLKDVKTSGVPPKIARTKVTFSVPESITDASRADVLTGLANATKLSIVCEDFATGTKVVWRSVARDFDQNTVAEVLDWEGDSFENYGRWFANDKKKLLVGWVEGDWMQRHRELKPAAP